MNYLEFFDKIKKYQNPDGPLPLPDEDPEAFYQQNKVFIDDKPLSGTDPIGKFVLEWIALDGPLKLLNGGIRKGIRFLNKSRLNKLQNFLKTKTAGTVIDLKELSPLDRAQAELLQSKGYDLTKFTVEDLQNLQKSQINNTLSKTKGRVNIVEPFSPDLYSVTDYTLSKSGPNINGKGLLYSNGKNLEVSNIAASNPGKFGERFYNSSIKLADQLNLDGVLSGSTLSSAPKTYSTWKHFPIQIVDNTGVHSNVRIVENPTTQKLVKTESELVEATKNGENAVLHGGRVVKLKKPSKLRTETDLGLFEPGRLLKEWTPNENIYKAVILPSIWGYEDR